MEVSKELLEEAAHSMLQGNPLQQQEAADFFESWQDSNDVMITASRIFLSSLNDESPISDSLQFIICCVILDASSSDAWYKYDDNSKNEIKQNIMEITYNFNHTKNVSEKLDQIIANISFNEWPENLPDFLPLMQNFLDIYVESKSTQTRHMFIELYFTFLSSFLRQQKLHSKEDRNFLKFL